MKLSPVLVLAFGVCVSTHPLRHVQGRSLTDTLGGAGTSTYMRTATDKPAAQEKRGETLSTSVGTTNLKRAVAAPDRKRKGINDLAFLQNLISKQSKKDNKKLDELTQKIKGLPDKDRQAIIKLLYLIPL
ncbi:hypothetical protein HIM_06749 [Hirsutella minnesotensis 3608]|uniref:Uncharacterized protein n=1 Tax=Hirsutella minnesotensis 3608 TaxID=1043627 RepID=A0A0F7ZIM6_9HYPO|nr:hypothetical protein HIM_06749 [Hirsutella minnesotensis 3608]